MENFIMWDINTKYLQKDETIEYTDRPRMLSLSCIISYIWVGLMALMVFTSIMFFITSALDKAIVTSMHLMIFVYVIFALPGVYVILKRLSTRYAISNRGLIKKTGIITNSMKTVPFKHITSIEVKESILGKIFRYADLLIETSGSGQAIEFHWDYVVAAHKVKKLIEKHIGVENGL
jgi:uncharacterized membrane protein YdbT with pleckstrin-like domain